MRLWGTLPLQNLLQNGFSLNQQCKRALAYSNHKSYWRWPWRVFLRRVARREIYKSPPVGLHFIALEMSRHFPLFVFLLSLFSCEGGRRPNWESTCGRLRNQDWFDRSGLSSGLMPYFPCWPHQLCTCGKDEFVYQYWLWELLLFWRSIAWEQCAVLKRSSSLSWRSICLGLFWDLLQWVAFPIALFHVMRISLELPAYCRCMFPAILQSRLF